MNSSRFEIWVAPSSISVLPKYFCSNRMRCWCSVCSSYSTLSTSKVMRKPRSSNSVSGIQRFSAMTPPKPWNPKALRPIWKRPGPGPAAQSSRNGRCALSVPTAKKLVHADALGGKCLAQHRDALVGLSRAAHEHVECGIADFRPSVDGDVALRQHSHAGDAVRLEVVQVDVQQCRLGGIDAAPQRRLDVVDVVGPRGAVQIDDQVRAGATHAVADREVIVAIVRRRRRDFELGLSCFR